MEVNSYLLRLLFIKNVHMKYVNIANLLSNKYTEFFLLRPAKIRTKHEKKIAIHPSSVNADEKEFESSWLLYHLKMKTVKVCLYHCLMLNCTCAPLFISRISEDMRYLTSVNRDNWAKGVTVSIDARTFAFEIHMPQNWLVGCKFDLSHFNLAQFLVYLHVI